MLGWLRKALATWLGGTRSQPARRLLRGKYDSAQTTSENSRHWANSDGLSAAAANSPDVRRTLRNRARYEYDNSGHLGGMIRGLANDFAGTGPTLQILTEDDGINTAVEMRFREWASAVGLSEKLWTAVQSKARDGEAFFTLRTNESLPTAVKLDLQIVEADRVTDPTGYNYATSNALDGITYGQDGRPTSYTILREHPGDTLRNFGAPHDILPARFVIHWFRKDRAGQLRGIPEVQAALPLCAQLRRWTLATLTAAETAASFAAVLESEASPDATGDTEDAGRVADPFNTLEIDRGMMTELPAGMKISQLDAKHPTTMYGDYKRELVTEMGRPIQMPANISTGTSSQYNYSSAKLDHFNYRGSLRVDRAFANEVVLEPIFRAWFAEASLIPGHLPAGLDVVTLPRAWYWPGWPSMDKDEASNDTERLNNGTATLAEILAEWGQDWRSHLAQRGREVALAREYGLAAEDAATMPAGDGTADPSADPAKPAGTAKQAAASGDVQATALNGAQIASLIALVDKLATKLYPAAAVEALVLAAFPLMDRDTIREFITALDEMPAPEPPPTPTAGPDDSEDDTDGETGNEAQAKAGRLALNGHPGR